MADALTVIAGASVALTLILLPTLLMSRKQAIAASEMARQRRLAEARMNARLLRMNL